MDWFACITRFYPKYWSNSMVGDAVVAGKLTESEYEEIVGESYQA